MIEFFVVGLGGFIGCCIRFGISKLMLPFALEFPAATLLSNIIAGFLIGFFAGMEKQVLWMTPRTKLFLTTGMLGGLSTFSTFNIETINLFTSGEYVLAVCNVLLNVALSFFGAALGLFTAKMIFHKSY